MKQPNRSHQEATPGTRMLVPIAGWCASASAVASVLGLLFLVAIFTLGGLLGPLNHIAVIIQYLFMLPIAVALWQIHGPCGPALGRIGMLAVIGLQSLPVAGALPFRQQIVIVLPAFLVVVVWFGINVYLDRSSALLPDSMGLNLLAGLYIAYPC